jgi:hypothetical protein
MNNQIILYKNSIDGFFLRGIRGRRKGLRE